MVEETKIDALHRLRKETTVLINKFSELEGSRELSLVRTKLQEAKMWAGKELGNLNLDPPWEKDGEEK